MTTTNTIYTKNGALLRLDGDYRVVTVGEFDCVVSPDGDRYRIESIVRGSLCALTDEHGDWWHLDVLGFSVE